MSYFKEDIDKNAGNYKELIDKLSEDLQELVKTKNQVQDEAAKLEKLVISSNENSAKIRKKNTYFKILGIGRIKSYYRFTMWKQYVQSPSNYEKEDKNLVEVYTSYVSAEIPMNLDPRAKEILLESLQQLLNHSSLKINYFKFNLKSTPMDKFSLISFLEEFFYEKAKFDVKSQANSLSYLSIPNYFFNRLKDMYGKSTQVFLVLSEIIPTLYNLYKESCPFAILASKLLQYLDPTPATNYESPAVLQIYVELRNIWQTSELFVENSETAGVYQLNHCLEVIRKVLVTDPEAYRIVMKNLEIEEVNKREMKTLIIMSEVFYSDLSESTEKLSENDNFIEFCDKDMIIETENESGAGFYKEISKDFFENQCKTIIVPGTTILLSVLRSLVLLKSFKIVKLYEYSRSESYIQPDELPNILKLIKSNIEDEEIEKISFFASSQNEDSRGITIKSLYSVLNKFKISGYWIKASFIKQTGDIEEESKSNQGVKSDNTISSSTVEKKIVKKLVKKKVIKK